MSRTGILAIAACAFILFAGFEASAQGFYPREWRHGNSGLFARDYVTPSEDLPGYLTGSAAKVRGTRGRLVFAAAAVDQRCQQDGSPRISILSAPRGSRVGFDIGSFTATGVDGGSSYCLGRRVRGTRVFYIGRPGSGERIVLRVAYPHKGLLYDHVISVR